MTNAGADTYILHIVHLWQKDCSENVQRVSQLATLSFTQSHPFRSYLFTSKDLFHLDLGLCLPLYSTVQKRTPAGFRVVFWRHGVLCAKRRKQNAERVSRNGCVLSCVCARFNLRWLIYFVVVRMALRHTRIRRHTAPASTDRYQSHNWMLYFTFS